MVAACQFDVIGLAARAVAEFCKFKPGNTATEPFGMYDAVFDFQGRVFRRFVA